MQLGARPGRQIGEVLQHRTSADTRPPTRSRHSEDAGSAAPNFRSATALRDSARPQSRGLVSKRLSAGIGARQTLRRRRSPSPRPSRSCGRWRRGAGARRRDRSPARRASLGERRQRSGNTPRERIAQESRADVRRLSEPLPHGLGERRQEMRTRQAGGASAAAGGKETAEEVVAGGRKARPQADQPRRRVAHGVEAPGLHAAAEIESRLRHRSPMAPDGRAPVEQRRDAQVGRRALLQRSSCATPARQRSSSPRSGGAGCAASRRAAAQSTRKRPRPADRSSTISSTAKTPPSPAASPSEEKSSAEARRTPRGRSSASALSRVRRSPSGELRFRAA